MVPAPGGAPGGAFRAQLQTGRTHELAPQAGLVVDHGDRYWRRSDKVLYELIVESGLQGELRSIELPVFDLGKTALCAKVSRRP
jgi:hypothetical protein